MNREQILKIIDILFVGLVVVIYGYIFYALDRGVSVDEGYYILSYNPSQDLSYGISQFYNIVRTLFTNDGALCADVMCLRYVRYGLNVVLLLVFTLTSYRWLIRRYGLSIRKLQYFGLVFLAGTLSFAFASPILYYDNIQLFLYLIVFSCFFSLEGNRGIFRFILPLFIGVFLIFGLFNYLPSGILLVGIVVLMIVVTKYEYVNKFVLFLLLLVGLVLGMGIYHLWVADITSTVSNIVNTLANVKNVHTGHDKSSLVVSAILYVFRVGGLLLFSWGLGLVLNYIRTLLKGKVIKVLFYTLLFLVVLFVLSQKWIFVKFYSDLLIIPIGLLISTIPFNKKSVQGKWFADFLIVLTFLFVPLMGMFGTNQDLSAKLLFFMPFWVVAFFVLKSRFVPSIDVVWFGFIKDTYLLLLLGSFIFLGYFSRYHYYYTPISSKYQLSEEVVFFKNIKVSQYQKDFYEHSVQTFYENGYRLGEGVLSFYDNFITVAMIGGYVPQNLLYEFDIYLSNKQNISVQPINYILIIKEQENKLAEFLKGNHWGFPDDYKRIDLGKAAENLPNNYETILFVKRK